MIAKRIDKDPKLADNFNHLGNYLAAADEPGEKLHELWISNCDAGETLEDLDGALSEIEATRKLNDRTSTNKTYHLVVSFRPGEGEKLTKDQLKDIEQSYAEALGFGDHQRIAATHQNTDHFHMHIAINKVHPKTLKIHTPFKDFVALEKTSRALEQKHGLSVDRGMSDRSDDGPAKINEAARDFEAHTWQQSFQGFMIEHRDEILKELGAAKNWDGVHAVLAEFGIELVKRGNGLVFKHQGGKQAMKASQLDRSCSKSALEGRLGAYEPSGDMKPGQDQIPSPEPEIGSDEGVKPSDQPSNGSRPRFDPGNDPSPSRKPQFGNERKSSPAGQDSAKQAFAAGKDVKASSRPRYEAKPLTNHPATSALWRRYLDYRPPRQPKASSFLGRFAANWKTWLYMEAYKDPAAIVIIMFYKELFGLFESKKHPERLPAQLRPALEYWRNCGTWAKVGSAKGGQIHVSPGCRLDELGNLVVPFRDDQGFVRGLRLVSPDGAAMDVGELDRSTHVIDPYHRLGAVPAIVTYDYALGSAIAEATEASVIVVSDKAGIGAVVGKLRMSKGLDPIVAVTPHDAHEKDFAAHTVAIDADARSLDIRKAFAALLNDRALLAWQKAKDWARPVNMEWLNDAELPGYGVKKGDDGRLMIPLKDVFGRLRDVLMVDGQGRAEPVVGDQNGPPLMHVIDTERRLGRGPIVIAADYASAAAIHRDTRQAVVMAASPEALEAVAEALRRRFPDERLVVALDDARTLDLEAAKRLVAVLVRSPANTTLASLAQQSSEAIRTLLADPLEDRAFTAWQNGRPVDEAAAGHPWLVNKPKKADLRIDDVGRLLVPLRDAGGRLWVVHSIDGQGVQEKIGHPKDGLVHAIGYLRQDDGGPVLLTDDYRSAAALRRATGRPVACTLATNDLPTAAAALKRRVKGEILVVASLSEGNHSLDSARQAAEAVGGRLVVPPLSDEDRAKGRVNFGDLAEAGSWEKFRAMAKKAIRITQAQEQDHEQDLP